MMTEPTHASTPTALYCRSTGRRLAPAAALEPAEGSPIAIAVFHDGRTIPLFGDTILGRAPDLDRRVISGDAAAITLDDPTRQLSRCHVLLRVDRWQIEVIDLGSRNGTAIRDEDGSWHSLMAGLGTVVEDGQLVRLASSVVRIHRLVR